MADCHDVVSLASLGLDGSLPADSAAHLAEHVRTCRSCTVYVQQMAASSALLSVKASSDTHRALVAVARASDPAHADDLVQETWDHHLGSSGGALPDQDELLEHLLRHVHQHQLDDDVESEVWADSLVHQHRHNPADSHGSDLPPDPGAHDSLRALADLDRLDADADRAELYFPDLYDDGAGRTSWGSPPTAWPTLSRILGPDAEVSTQELYDTIDAALDELPEPVADVVNLVDVEGQSLERAMLLFSLSRRDAERHLVIGRNHLRGRISTYLAADG